MMSTLAPPSVLSAPQRRCQVLLTLFLPGQIATTQTFSSLNGVDDATVQEDIIGAGLEIQRYHRLAITTAQNGAYAIEGTPLNQRLCLLQWLRRGLRICPTFIAQHFTPALKMELKNKVLHGRCMTTPTCMRLLTSVPGAYRSRLSAVTFSSCACIYNIACYSITRGSPRSLIHSSNGGRNPARSIRSPRKLAATGSATSCNVRRWANRCLWRCYSP